MQRIWLKSWRNQVPFACVIWAGPGSYAGATLGSTFEVFPVRSEEEARWLRAAYIGRFKELAELLADLRERGGYEFNESPLG